MIIRSPHGDVTVPDVTLPAYVLGDAEARGDKPALIDGPTGRALSYAELVRAVRSVAAGLAERGFGKRRRPRAVRPEHARVRGRLPRRGRGWAASSRRSTRSTRRTSSRFQLEDAGARLAVTGAPCFEAACEEAGARGGLRARRRPIVRRPARRTRTRRRPTPASTRTDLVVLPVLERHDRAAEGRDADAPQPGREPLPGAARCSRIDRGRHGRSACLPFFHIYGMTVIMNQGLRAGATVVTMPRFDLDAVPRADRAPRASPAPTSCRRSSLALAKHPARRRPRPLERCDGSCRAPRRSAPSSPSACAERLGCTVVQGYGLTETSPVTHADPPGRARTGRARSARRSRAPSAGSSTPRPARTSAPGERGELWIRGPQVMRGYLNNERGDRGDRRRRRLAAHRRHRPRRRGRLLLRSSTGSRS